MSKTSLPVNEPLRAGRTLAGAVDCIEIDTPCDVTWESLRGDDRVRHCDKCRQNVYNLEAMDRQEALGHQGPLSPAPWA